MTLRLVQVNIKARDDDSVGRFWADALGWDVSNEGPGVANVEPPDILLPSPGVLGIDVVAVPDLVSVKYRTHLELAASSEADSAQLAERLQNAGATSVGRGEWADPEGNAFRIQDPGEFEAATGPIAAVVVDCLDPRFLATFWGAASDWATLGVTDEQATLRSSSGAGPFLRFARNENVESVRTRMHIDLRPYPGDDQRADVERLIGLGAAPADIGQGDAPWTVLTDPEGNEFCVLTPG